MRIRRYRDVLSNGIFQEMPEMRTVYDATSSIQIWIFVHVMDLSMRIFRRYWRHESGQQNDLYRRWSK